MKTTNSKLIEIIKIKIPGHITLGLRCFNDFIYWKAVYPEAYIISYNIQTV
ncbi:MAG: hypothetical protein ACJA2N_000770 [Salibacteraceae bacterium]|jgi:hypothetical protein